MTPANSLRAVCQFAETDNIMERGEGEKYGDEEEERDRMRLLLRVCAFMFLDTFQCLQMHPCH